MKIEYKGNVQMHSNGRVFVKGTHDVPKEVAEYLVKTFGTKFMALQVEKPKEVAPVEKSKRSPRNKKVEE